MAILVVDIDQTLANHDHRAHFVDCPTPDWITFLKPELVAKDIPIPIAQKCLPDLIKKSHDFFLLTGRQEHLRKTTKIWLKKHFKLSIGNSRLLMRQNGEPSSSSDHKEEMLIKKILPKKFNLPYLPIILIDDDEHVLYKLSKYAITMKAPECWEVLAHEKPNNIESLYSR